MSLLNFHGNTRERLHPWRKLPERHPEALGRERCHKGRGWGQAREGQGTANLLTCLGAFLFTRIKNKNKKSWGSLEAQEVASLLPAATQLLQHERSPQSLDQPQTTKTPKGPKETRQRGRGQSGCCEVFPHLF